MYARQIRESSQYFEELMQNLVKYSTVELPKRIGGYEGEEKILIELATVMLL